VKRLVLSAAVLIVLFAAPAALAQGTGGFQFGLTGGVSVPTGDSSNAFDNGYHGGLVLNYELPALPLGLRVDGDYRHFSAKTGATNFSGSAQIVDGNANLVVGIRILLVKIYALGGGGVYNVKFSAEGDRVSTSDSQTKFGWNGGVGAALVVGKVSIFAEGRYHEVTLDTGQGKFKLVAASAGILF
jgi:hypothetical protein